MALFTIKDLTFTYPARDVPALNQINLTVDFVDFITLCGKSGCGKSTLLRHLKTVLAPHGKLEGEIFFDGKSLKEVSQREQASRIGYVLQNPDQQIVTDTVWHELAFGLESLGCDQQTIRMRVAEMASFFGIQGWFMRKVSELSGGQKQLLNLASIMAMQPDVLILDEPTSQLDPIAAGDFLETVKRINREIGTTVILSEHRLEEVLPMSDRAVVLDGGKLLLDDTPEKAGRKLAQWNHEMFLAMPSPMQIYAGLVRGGMTEGTTCPITVREGRKWLSGIWKNHELRPGKTEAPGKYSLLSGKKYGGKSETPVIELRDVWFRYGKNEPDVVKDLSLKVFQGQFHCIVGGNGTGKTTALSLISGLYKPYRGKVFLLGREMGKIRKEERYQGMLGVLPQNPQSLFVEKTVELDLLEILDQSLISQQTKIDKVKKIAKLVEIENLMQIHPYDLSGGEQQRAALGKILLLEPEILLLDEPTKGMDNYFKAKLAGILDHLREKGITVVMVSHDIEFCARYGDLCSMFFDGGIVSTNTPGEFFSGNSFYTTAANRMSRHLFPGAVTSREVIELCLQNR
jgi:energy-coupling factor transporter ATP-binding protein EcfA2